MPRPFWFLRSELAEALLHAEIVTVNKLIARHPDLLKLFDAPETTVSQRRLCFVLLAHREVLEIINEWFAGRYEQPSGGISDAEQKIVNLTTGLVSTDAPEWALEMGRVVNRLAGHLRDALPPPLEAEGYNSDNPAQSEAILTAASTLDTVEKLQAWIEKVLKRQLQRLRPRWTAIRMQVARVPNKRKGWEQKQKLHIAIQKVLSAKPGLQGMEFCAELDKHHPLPLYDWTKRGEWRDGLTWKEAWGIPSLRRKIRRVRQEAMKSL